jgi:hypothetical protein
MASSSWSRTRSTGFSAFIALWKTIAISRHRSARSCAGDAARTSTPAAPRRRPWYVTLPPVITAGGRSSRTAP